MEGDSTTMTNHDDRVVTRHHSPRQTEKGRTLPHDERERKKGAREGEKSQLAIDWVQRERVGASENKRGDDRVEG
jgi:hypothetical protein